MGSIEKKAGERKKKENLQKAALHALKIAGTLSLAALAPKLFMILRRKGSLSPAKMRTVADRLIAKKLVEKYRHDGEISYRLTEEGERWVDLELQVASSFLKKKKRWDGLWRVVIFDIPESRQRIRKELVSLLREVGFLKIQNSVWIFPYDCEELLALIKAEMRIGKEVLYMVVSALESDQVFRTHFRI